MSPQILQFLKHLVIRGGVNQVHFKIRDYNHFFTSFCATEQI